MSLFWFIIRFLAVTVGFAALHYYLWWRLFRDTTERGSLWRPVGAVVLGVLAGFGLLARFFTPSDAPLAFQSAVGWPGLIWFGLFLYLFGLLIVGEAVRWLLVRRSRRGLSEGEAAVDRADGFYVHLRELAARLRLLPRLKAPPVEPEPVPETVHTRRRLMSRAIGVGAAATAVATVGHGLYEGYRTPPLKPVTVSLAKLDRRFDGYRIAVVGDTHFSAIRGRGYCERVVDQINRADADLIAFVGDLASNEADQVRDATDPLARLRARDGAYFVAGNAEHYVGADEWYDRVAELGMIGLPNTRVELAAFDLAGINDLIVEERGFSGETGPDFEAALGDRDPDRPVVFLAHQPNAIERAVDYGVDLQLSGHTHGGQMWPVHYASLIRSGQLTGLERHGDAQVYVTNGAGTNGPPIRVGADADITVLTLRSPH
ncbi:metallophosphoesterase [Glycomyces paridis]|uniref:Metallophosphoesterase n=1 Tax=Glycomyces paridis TaxID=2126555 RepID=A0A4S8P2K2_9ACTN|nr:metallophosphoesterase [Glycomyces paridis]THV23531.1 metallophosphoesterase [Glycomyces paridis]